MGLLDDAISVASFGTIDPGQASELVDAATFGLISADDGGSSGRREGFSRREQDIFDAAVSLGYSEEEAANWAAFGAGSDTAEVVGLMQIEQLYLGPATDLHEENIALQEQQLALQLDMSDQGIDIATAQERQSNQLFRQYQKVFAPAQEEVVRGAMAGIPVDPRLNHLTNDVRIGFDKQRQDLERQLQRFGLDPSDPVHRANMAQLAQAQAATEVGVRNQARSEIEEENFNRQIQAVSLGSVLPSQATSAAGAAAGALDVASRTAGRGFSALGGALESEAALFGGLARTALAGEEQEAAARRTAEAQEEAGESALIGDIAELGTTVLVSQLPGAGPAVAPAVGQAAGNEART